MSTRAIVGIAALLALAAAEPRVSSQGRTGEQRWVGTWFAPSTARIDPATPPARNAVPGRAPIVIPPGVAAVAPGQELPIGGQSPLHFHNQTLRQIAHISIGGSRFRVVFSNVFGMTPLRIGAAQIGLRAKDATIGPSTNRALTFGGEAQAAVSPGAILISDAVDLVVPDFADLAIDLYLPDDTLAMKSPITTHPASWQTNYVSVPGNHAGQVMFPVQTTTAYWRGDGVAGASSFFLTRVETLASAGTGVVVAIGDSITDGTHSTIDTNNRWPDHLARRFARAGMRMSVLNAGIGGNRILADGNGPSALARFDRDVIAQPGATHAILLEGINDIGQARQAASPSAAELIGAHRQMIERAHARGLKIYGATLTPFEGANSFTAEGEAKRQALNAWLRVGTGYDSIFDFDAAVRDPNRPAKIRSEYDPGDHLHLNAAGYEALANTIDLALFRIR